MPTKILDCKICIIGAGPGGATTSLFLSKKRIPHIIIDAATFPRDKVCGDALDLKVMRVLNQLDPTIVEREILPDENFAKAFGASVIVAKDKKHNLNLDPTTSKYPYFIVAKRAYFDNFLVKKIDPAYANFLQATKVKKLKREDGKWIIATQNDGDEIEIHADLIVGADGDHSTVLRTLGERKIDRSNYAGALRQYWKGISGLNPNNHLEIYLPKSLPLGYLWIFPLPNGEANVGCGLVSELIAKRSIDLKKVFRELITDDPIIAERFKNATPLEKPVGWGLPYASQQRQASGDGYLLVGDAAAMVCPTTGEGIGPAMISGLIAAEFIEHAMKIDRFNKEVFKNYDREILKRLQGDIKKFRMLKVLPASFYSVAIRVLSALGISQYYFNKNIKSWIETATIKPIEVEL